MMDGEKIKEEAVLISCHVRTALALPAEFAGICRKVSHFSVIFTVHDSISSP